MIMQKNMPKEDLIQALLSLCISEDGKLSIKESTMRRKGEKWLRDVYSINMYQFIILAGKQAGMKKDSGTASSFLWEIEKSRAF